MNTSTEQDIVQPILIVDHLSKDYGKNEDGNIETEKEISPNEKVLLTLIAKIIVEIIIKEEL